MTNSWDDTLEHPIAIERNLHVIHPHEDFLAPRTCHFEWENPMVLGWTGDVHFIDCGVLIRFRGQHWGSGAHGHVSWLDTGHGVGVPRLFDHHLCGRLHQYGISGGLPMSPSREVQPGADALWDHFQDRALITAFSMFSMFSHVPTPNSYKTDCAGPLSFSLLSLLSLLSLSLSSLALSLSHSLDLDLYIYIVIYLFFY